MTQQYRMHRGGSYSSCLIIAAVVFLALIIGIYISLRPTLSAAIMPEITTFLTSNTDFAKTFPQYQKPSEGMSVYHKDGYAVQMVKFPQGGASSTVCDELYFFVRNRQVERVDISVIPLDDQGNAKRGGRLLVPIYLNGQAHTPYETAPSGMNFALH